LRITVLSQIKRYKLSRVKPDPVAVFVAGKETFRAGAAVGTLSFTAQAR
jgi:hypothetical protein